jgi:hypothetical protein
MPNNTMVHTSLLVSVTTWNWKFSCSLSSICDMCWTVLKRWHPHWTETFLLRWHLLIEQTNCTTLSLPALSPYNLLPNHSPTCGRIHSAFMKTEKGSSIDKDTLWKQRASTSNQTTAESPTFVGFLRGLQSQVLLHILLVCPHPPWAYNVSTTLNLWNDELICSSSGPSRVTPQLWLQLPEETIAQKLFSLPRKLTHSLWLSY